MTLINTEEPLSTNTVFGCGVCYRGEKGLFEGDHGAMDVQGKFTPSSYDDTSEDIYIPTGMLDAFVQDLAKLEAMAEFDYSTNPAMVCVSGEKAEVTKEDFVLVTCLPCKNEVVFAGDAAFKRKCCKGASGEKSHLPCETCPCVRKPGESNIGDVFIIVEATRGMTLGDLAEKHDMSFDQLEDANDAHNHDGYVEYTGVGIAACGMDDRKPVDLSGGRYDSQTKCSSVQVGRGRGRKRLFRVRIIWPSTGEGSRELIDTFAKAGFGWEKFMNCALHEVLRSTEWLVHNTIRYSGKTPKQVQAVLDRIGSKLALKYDGERFLKPSINEKKQAMWWFEEVLEQQDDGTFKSRKRWEWLAREIDGRDDTWAVWSAYDDYKSLILCMHPSPEEQSLIGPLSLDYFLAFRKRWDKVEDVHHYLHQDFAHATFMMKRHKSIGAFRQEMEEKLHSEALTLTLTLALTLMLTLNLNSTPTLG